MKTNYKIPIGTIVVIFCFISFNSCKKEKDKITPEPVINGLGLVETPDLMYDSIPDAPEIPPSGTLPSSFFLKIPSQPFNQGQQGSCASCATAMSKSILDHEKLGIPYSTNSIVYSPSYLFNQVHENPNDCTKGSLLPNNFSVLKDQGVCKISEMPYDYQDCSKQPSPSQINSASSHRIDHYFKLDPISIATIKEFIHAGLPVIVAFKVDEDFYDNDNMDIWKSWGWKYIGYHAAILYGWDDSKNAFKLLNSWGSQWKDNGTGWVDYNFVQNGWHTLAGGKIFREAYIIQNPKQAIVKPIADFDITGTNKISKGQSVTFNDRSMNTPTSWSWSFPGGTPNTSNQQNPTISYGTVGSYDVSLTVSNQHGSNVKTAVNYIEVGAITKEPIAQFSTKGVEDIYTGEAIKFFDESLNNPTSWSWSFPNGSPNSSTLKNPIVTYNAAGTYNVGLTASNQDGSNSISKQFYVMDKTVGGMSIQPGLGKFTGCDYPASTRDLSNFDSWFSWLYSDYLTNVFKLKVASIDSSNGTIEFVIKRCDNYNFKSNCTIDIYETNPVYKFTGSYLVFSNEPEANLKFQTKFAGHDSKNYIAVITNSSLGGEYYCTKEITITW
jgi:PKD repeat protein